MGPCCVIIVLLFAAIIYGFIFIVFSSLYVLGCKKHLSWLKWTTGIPAVLMALLAISLVAWFSYSIIDSMNPKSVFKDTFGEYPSSEVNDIHSKVYFFADEGSIYLIFKTSKSEFVRLVPSGLTERTLEDMKKTDYDISSEAPSWWTFRYQSGWIYYIRKDYRSEGSGKHGFSGETEYYAYDPNSNTAYYRFLGID